MSRDPATALRSAQDDRRHASTAWLVFFHEKMKGLIDLIADSLRYSGSQVAGPCGKQISPSFFVKYTHYFLATRQRPDRAVIKLEWIQYVMEHPEQETIQADGRIRRWAAIQEMNHRYLRVILLPDGETVHNAFFDRSFKP